MNFDSRTYEQILSDNPSCFAVPHASAFDPLRCETCMARRPCYEVSAQLLLAKKIGLLNGKIVADAQYSAEDAYRIGNYVMANAPHKSAAAPCNPKVLPQLYDRAMLAYKNRLREQSHDEIMAELDSLLPVSESRGIVASSSESVEERRSTSPSVRSAVSSETSLGEEASPTVRDDASAQGKTTSAEAVVATDDAAGPVLVTPVTLPLPYAFPMPDTRQYTHYTNEALVNAIQLLVERGRLSAATRNYSLVRRDICAIHIEMNLRQQHAPRFRPQPTLPKKAESNDEKNLALDRQVIDLHWRANSSDKPMIPVAHFEGIFDNERFDFELAARFAQLDWRQQTKAIHLHLTEDMQWEHAIIQAPIIRCKWRTIERGDVRGSEIKQAGAPHIQTRLHQAMANSPHLRVHIPGLVRIWMAQRIVENSPQRVSRLVALMTGEKARDASAIRRSMATLDARLAAAKAGC